MAISKEYIRSRLSIVPDIKCEVERVVLKRSWKAKLYGVYIKIPIIFNRRHKIKEKILSIPFLSNFLIRHKQKLLSTPIIKDIIALFR